MATYVPGTMEKDLTKLVRSLQQLGPGLDAMKVAWTNYTPILSAGTGSLTSASGTGYYLNIGKTVFIKLTITITTNGTAGGSVLATLPFTVRNVGDCILAGREEGSTGKMLQGVCPASSTAMFIAYYDNSYPGFNGAVLTVSGVYEAA